MPLNVVRDGNIMPAESTPVALKPNDEVPTYSNPAWTPRRSQDQPFTLDDVVRILSWTSKASVPAFLLGNLVFLVMMQATATGLASLLSKVLVTVIGWRFVKRYVGGGGMPSVHLTADIALGYLARLEAISEWAAIQCDDLMTVKDVSKSAMTVVVLYGLSKLMTVVGALSLAYIVFVGSFLVGPVSKLVGNNFREVRARAALRPLTRAHRSTRHGALRCTSRRWAS